MKRVRAFCCSLAGGLLLLHHDPAQAASIDVCTRLSGAEKARLRQQARTYVVGTTRYEIELAALNTEELRAKARELERQRANTTISSSISVCDGSRRVHLITTITEGAGSVPTLQGRVSAGDPGLRPDAGGICARSPQSLQCRRSNPAGFRPAFPLPGGDAINLPPMTGVPSADVMKRYGPGNVTAQGPLKSTLKSGNDPSLPRGAVGRGDPRAAPEVGGEGIIGSFPGTKKDNEFCWTYCVSQRGLDWWRIPPMLVHHPNPDNFGRQVLGRPLAELKPGDALVFFAPIKGSKSWTVVHYAVYQGKGLVYFKNGVSDVYVGKLPEYLNNFRGYKVRVIPKKP